MEFDTRPDLDEVIEIDRHLAQTPTDPDYGAKVERRFSVINEQTATWAAEKIAKHRARIAEVRAVTAERRAAVDAWERSQVADSTRSVQYLTALLDEWARPIIAARTGNQSKTIALPDGTKISYRAASPNYVGADKPAVLSFAEEVHPLFVEKRLRWADFKAAAHRGDADADQDPRRLYVRVPDDNGELHDTEVPDITVTDVPDSLTVTGP